MFEIILIIILLILIDFCDAARDKMSFHWGISIFAKYPKLFPPQFWNPATSWKNKWVLDENGEPKLDDKGNRIPKKWFGIIDIPDVFTDAWHVLKGIGWTAILVIAAINLPLYGFILNFVIVSAIYLFFWWLFFDVLLVAKK